MGKILGKGRRCSTPHMVDVQIQPFTFVYMKEIVGGSLKNSFCQSVKLNPIEGERTLVFEVDFFGFYLHFSKRKMCVVHPTYA